MSGPGMDPKRFVKFLAVVVTTLDGLPGKGAPEGLLYTGLMSDGCTLSEFETVRDALLVGGLATRPDAHFIVLTDSGSALAVKIEARLSGTSS